MQARDFLHSMQEREGKPVRLWLRDRSNVAGVLVSVSTGSLLLRDGRGRKRSLPIAEVTAWEDGLRAQRMAGVSRGRRG